MLTMGKAATVSSPQRTWETLGLIWERSVPETKCVPDIRQLRYE